MGENFRSGDEPSSADSRGTQNSEETRLMAAATLRRAALTASLAAIATALVPTAVSLAAPSAFAASSITTDPKPDSNNVVAANRPKIVATFNSGLASGSISLTAEGGNGTNLCGTQSISGDTVTCQPTSDLDKTAKYDAVGTGTDSAGHKAKTSTLTFTVDYPVLDDAGSTPVPGGTLVSGGENITAKFDEAVTGDTNTFHPQGAFKLFEINADGSRGFQLGGTTTFGGNTLQGSDGTVTFDPAANLSNGRYEAILFVNGVTGSAPNTKANPDAIGRADYFIFINNSAPFGLNNPVPTYNGVPYANTSNNTAFPFAGYAAPGLTVTVTVKDPQDPNPLTNTYSGSTTVPTCASAPSCPWTVKIDISGMTNPQAGVTWTAVASDASKATTASGTGPKFNVDYSAPPAVTVNPAPSISSDSKTVTVNAQDTGTDVVSYLVTITDPEGNQLTPTFPAQNHNLPATPIDVTPLDDGTLSITIQAVDNVGNTSPTPNSPTTPANQKQPWTVTKNVGLQPNLGTSVLTANGTDVTFLAAEQQSVASPDKVTVGFTQTIKQSYQDQTKAPPATNNSSMCIASQNGNCLQSNAATVNSDNRSLSMKVTNKLADGVYEIHVHTYSAGNCPDKTPVNASTYSCDDYNGLVLDPNTGQPFQFRVDSTKPSLAITSYPKVVTAQNEKSVTISGTVSKTASSVQLFLTSSGNAGAKLLYSATITQPASSTDPDATWSVGPVDISSLPDGTLTIKAVAKKSNGTSATKSVKASMQAHASHLTATPNHRRVTAGHPIKILGHLTDEAGSAIANADITVRPRFASGHFGKAVTAVTNSGGGYTAKFVPKRNATYYATYAGSTDHDGVKTHTAKVLVRFAVTITSPTYGAHVSSPVTIKGKVAPHHKGALVTIYRHTSSGNTVVGKARLNKHSRFSVSVVLPAGTDVVYAAVGKTSNNAAGKSKHYKLHVS